MGDPKLKNQRSLLFYLARLAWLAMALVILVFSILGAYYSFQELMAVPQEMSIARTGLPAPAAALLTLLLEALPALVSYALGILLFVRVANPGQKYDRMVLFISFMLMAFGFLVNANINAVPDDALLVQVTYLTIALAGLILFLFFFLLFPDGQLRPRWSWIFPVGLLVWIASWFFFPALNPQGWPDLAFSMLGGALLLVGVSFQVYRYIRYSTPIQRQQTKMVCYSLVILVFFGFLEIWIDNNLLPYAESRPNGHWIMILADLISALGVIAFPVVLAISITRYRLWDIDIVIRRTVLYSLLTGMLTLIYLTSILLLQQLFRGGDDRSQLTVVLSTLISVILARPLWRQTQNLIDRNFYRGRYNAEKTLAEFSAAINREVELEQLSNYLVMAARETVQPEYIALWMRSAPGAGISHEEQRQLAESY